MISLITVEFVIWYVLLNALLFFIAKTYLAESIQPHFVTLFAAVALAVMTLINFPRPNESSDLITDMILYIIIAGIPVVLGGFITTRLVTDFVVGSGDFDAGSEAGFINDIKIPLDTFVSVGHFYEGIEFLRNCQAKPKYKKDYRINLEIAAIAMTSLKDYPLALSEYKKVLKMTNKSDIVSFCLYRIADINAFDPDKKDETKKYLKELLSRFPKTEFAKSAEVRLRLLERDDSEEDSDGSLVFANLAKSTAQEPPTPSLLFGEHTLNRSGERFSPDALTDTSSGDAYQILLKRSVDKSRRNVKTEDLSEQRDKLSRSTSPFAPRLRIKRDTGKREADKREADKTTHVDGVAAGRRGSLFGSHVKKSSTANNTEDRGE